MGLYDNIILPEDIKLPEFPENPRYDNESNYRLWQTKDLTRGQDRYRLRKIDSNNGSHQLERRVPPIQKMTSEGNEILRDSELLWWNIVRPTETVTISEVSHNKIYNYDLDFVNGTLRDIKFSNITVI